jgi:regulator of protease activity HflC (stomatin/prohibitin superfamily)
MSKLDIILLIVLGSTLVISVILFFVSGIYRVKKGYMMVIEKAEKFYQVCPEGRYYFMPVMYKRKGIYPLEPLEKDLHLKNGNVLLITYQIVDVKKFHYSSRDIELEVNKAVGENPEMSKEILETTLDNIGVKFLGIRKK